MAFPTIPTVAAGRVLSVLSTNPQGTHTSPDLSSLTKNSGDLLIAIVIFYAGNSTNAEFSSWGGGFTEFGDFASSGGSTMAIGLAYKWSDGSETGTFTVDSVAVGSNDSAFFLLSIPGAHPSTPPEAGSFATGTGAAADPGSFNPSGWDAEDTLWIAVGGSGETSTSGTYTGIASAPTNYSDYADSGISADAIGGVEGAVAFRQLAAASEDVGTFTQDTSNARSAALVIAVRPAPPPPFAWVLTRRRAWPGTDFGATSRYHARPAYVRRTTSTYVNTIQPTGGPIIRAWAEALTSSDAFARLGTFLRTKTHAPTTSDVWSRSLSLFRTWTSALTSSDAWTRAITYGRSMTSALATSDAWSRTATLLRTQSHSLTSSDAFSRTGGFLRAWSEAASTSDAWVALRVILRTWSEALTSSDAWTRTGTFVRSWTTTLTSSDAWTRVLTAVRSWSEAATSSDVWTGIRVILRSWAEAAATSDTWNRVLTAVRSLAPEAVTSSDAWTRTGTFLRTLTEALTTADGWIAEKLGGIKFRTMAENISTNDTWTRTSNSLRGWSESITTSDAWVAVRVILRTFASTLTSSDAWTRTAAYTRSWSTTLTSLDVWTRVGQYTRSWTTALITSDTWSRLVSGVISGLRGPKGIAVSRFGRGLARRPDSEGQGHNPDSDSSGST